MIPLLIAACVLLALNLSALAALYRHVARVPAVVRRLAREEGDARAVQCREVIVAQVETHLAALRAYEDDKRTQASECLTASQRTLATALDLLVKARQADPHARPTVPAPAPSTPPPRSVPAPAASAVVRRPSAPEEGRESQEGTTVYRREDVRRLIPSRTRTIVPGDTLVSPGAQAAGGVR